MTYMYDVINSGSSGLERFNPSVVAGYVTPGAYEWTSAEWALYPHAQHVYIANNGGTPSRKPQVMDVENGDFKPADIPGYAARTEKQFGPQPQFTVYCMISNLAAVSDVWKGPIWLAAPSYPSDAQATALRNSLRQKNQIVAIQNVWAGSYDRSLIFDPEWPVSAETTKTVSHADIDGFNLPAASSVSGYVPAVIKWLGSDGVVTRQSNIPEKVWTQIPWSK